MLNRTMILLVLVGVLFGTGCTNPPPSSIATAHPVAPTPTQAPDLTLAAASPSPTGVNSAQELPELTLTLTPEPLIHEPEPGRTLYTLRALLDFEEKYLAVNQTVTYFYDGPEPLNDLLLVVDPNWQPGIFELESLTWEDGTEIEGAALAEGILRAPLESPLLTGEAITFQVAYSLRLPARQGTLGYTQAQINLGNWYPFIPPFDPTLGWLAYRPGIVGEYLAYDIADYQVELEVENAPEGLVIAAPAPSQDYGDIHRYSLESSRNFSLSLSPMYEMLTASTAADVEIRHYAYTGSPQSAADALALTVQAVELFSELFGPYGHDMLTIVQADFPDGMEFDGLYFLGEAWYLQHEKAPTSFLSFLAVHETAHQWWYGRVGSDQAMEPWLDESLSTYSEIIFYEKNYPNFGTWWWDTRVNFYDPDEGLVGDPIYKYGAFRPYVDGAYLRGARFLDALRGQIGEEAFFNALRQYATTYDYREARSEDFFAIVDAQSGGDYSLIYDIYFLDN